MHKNIHMLRELHLVEFSDILTFNKCKTDHDVPYTATALVCNIELQIITWACEMNPCYVYL